MSRKIALIVSMLMFVVGCDSMGSRVPIVRAQADDDVTASAVVHYYVTEDGAVMELWVDSSCTPDSIDTTVWQEVSLDSLHALGIYSPAENVAQAVEDGTAGPIGETFSGNYRSYITCRRIYDRWQITLGSETWRVHSGLVLGLRRVETADEPLLLRAPQTGGVEGLCASSPEVRDRGLPV